MSLAKTGDTVQVHYIGKLEDGSIFDSSLSNDPLQFTIGEQQVLRLFEETVIGMNVGDKKSVFIPFLEGYGEYLPDLCIPIPRNEFQPPFEYEVGLEFEMFLDEKQSVFVTIKEINDEHVIVDANHMLAGKDLFFDVELVNIL